MLNFLNSNEGTIGELTGNGSGWEFEIEGIDFDSEPFEVKSRFPERGFDKKVHECSCKPSVVKFRGVKLLLLRYRDKTVTVWVNGSPAEANRVRNYLLELLEVN